MSDWSSEFAGEVAQFERRQEQRYALKAHQNFRNNTWRTKDGRELTIKDMEDLHLLNAYKKSGCGDLFNEMVVRLFEERMKK